MRSDRRSSHTEHIVSSLSSSLAVIATRSDILRSSSSVTECAYSPPLGRRFSLLPRITEGRGLANKELRFCVFRLRLLASANRYGCAVLCASVGVQSFRGLPTFGRSSQVSVRALPSLALLRGRESNPPNVAEYRATLSRISITIVPIHLERYLGVVYQNRFCG